MSFVGQGHIADMINTDKNNRALRNSIKHNYNLKKETLPTTYSKIKLESKTDLSDSELASLKQSIREKLEKEKRVQKTLCIICIIVVLFLTAFILIKTSSFSLGNNFFSR